jgi:anthranilate synthase component 2
MILLIDNYDSFTYNLYQAVAVLHENVKVIRNDKLTVADVHALAPAGIIISPGPGRPEDAGICIELIRNLPENTPLLGVCLGHQAIVAAFGGKIIRAPEIVHGKDDNIFHHRKGLYQGLSLPFKAARYHSLIAEKSSLPAELLVEAENAEGLIMGVRHQSKPIYGIQCHPESILTPEGPLLLKAFVASCQS